MLSRLYIFLLAGLFAATALQGQVKQLRQDSLYRKLRKDSAWIYRPRAVFPLVAIDQRNSFLRTAPNTTSPVNIWGAKAGITLYDRHNMGIGGYSLRNSSRRVRMRDNATINSTLDFKFLTLFYEYSIIESKWWEVGIPVEAGYGYYKLTSVIESSDEVLPTRHGAVFPLGTALDVYFKPTRWFGINLMGGYRYVINNTSRLNLSGWFYSVGLAVYVRQILQDSRFYLKKRTYKREVEKLNLLPD